MNARSSRFSVGVVALALLLAGCSSPGVNTSLNSVRQPVVERTSHTLDLTTAGGELPASEQAKLVDWFKALGLGYGDRVTFQGDPRQRTTIAALAARHAVLLSDAASEPSTSLQPGTVRVSVQRSRAYVPDCPDWSANSSANLDNSTSPGFGCAVNGNLAAMVADPEHLLAGAQGAGETVVMSATRAIASYRATEPTGAEGLAEISSRGSDDE